MKYPEQESSILEFKRDLPKNDQIIKTIIGFCNQNGGKLIIGVDDNGTIVGIPEEKIDQILDYIDKSIYESSYPPIIPRVYAQRFGAKTILIIEVSPGMNKPYYIKSEGIERGTYIRLGRTTIRATPDIIDELKLYSRGRSFDMTPVYQARLEDLDQERFKSFLEAKKISVSSSAGIEKIFEAYHLIANEHNHWYPTVAGILLFGKNPQHFFHEAIIISTHFAGISGRETIATKDCTGTLTEQLDAAYHFALSQLTRSFSIKGLKRKEQYEIPEEAFREVLVNAIVHRNYHLSSPTKIAIYDNRIEVFSPGSFPGPLHAKNLRMGLTYIRNTAITRVFRELGLMEKLGSGFSTLFESYEARGLPEPQVIEGENYIKCILPRPTTAHKKVMRLASWEKKVLNLFQTNAELSIGDVIEQLEIPRATAGRQLSALVDAGFLKKVGRAKNTRYVKIK